VKEERAAGEPRGVVAQVLHRVLGGGGGDVVVRRLHAGHAVVGVAGREEEIVLALADFEAVREAVLAGRTVDVPLAGVEAPVTGRSE
jgi:hypothetical protein